MEWQKNQFESIPRALMAQKLAKNDNNIDHDSLLL